ncbi:HAUS augmin-like complex subunit 1 [Microcaecilia unicolor]|uniref:HAUS augmin-like complex subunit 1 n=1 Tax=Microcaecilia unicolor TaxID=1415580 RepID=A0A6P7XDR7_9AMPH|nr:HAUS augmin-like complex subunit 1 [Microcaecilia unicolor]
MQTASSLPRQVDLIVLWLKKVFGDKPISHYEVNTRTTDILYQLAACNEARDKDISLVIEDIKLKTVETAAEANFLQDLLLETMGPSFTRLSRMGSSYLNELVDSTLVLDVKDTSLASYIPAVIDLTSELLVLESKNQEMELELTNLRKKLTAALVLEKTLQEDLRKAEEQWTVERTKLDSRMQNMEFLKAKSEELTVRIKAAEEQLSATGMDPSLSHQSLVALSEKRTKLKEEAVPLKKKLESYLDLSPNPSLAQVKIEEAKRELSLIDAELTRKVDMMELALPEQNKRLFP